MGCALGSLGTFLARVEISRDAVGMGIPMGIPMGMDMGWVWER